jgi:protease-4
MTETYDQFTQRVMSTRGGKIKKIEDVAQGRVFVAPQAKEVGLIDEIGGTDKAITYAANQADLKPGGYEVRVVPPPRTLADLISGGGLSTQTPVRSQLRMSDSAILLAMPKELRSMIQEQVQILQVLADHPVALVTPFSVREK